MPKSVSLTRVMLGSRDSKLEGIRSIWLELCKKVSVPEVCCFHPRKKIVIDISLVKIQNLQNTNWVITYSLCYTLNRKVSKILNNIDNCY